MEGRGKTGGWLGEVKLTTEETWSFVPTNRQACSQVLGIALSTNNPLSLPHLAGPGACVGVEGEEGPVDQETPDLGSSRAAVAELV
jgi:hypothetical protein